MSLRSIALALSVALSGALLLCAPVSAAPTVTCVYTASNHRVKATINGTGYMTMGRDNLGHIKFGSVWCGNAATVYNTDQINVFAGEGNQALTVNWNANGGFQPGFTNERGSSDEVEISISLGGGDSDVVNIATSGPGAEFVAGRSSGGFAVLGRINANANESTGVDADITLSLGVENLGLAGSSGADTMSGAGGFGTGESYIGQMYITGGAGPDNLTGGDGADWLIGGAASDVLHGGAGPDILNTADGVDGNDQIFGGKGADTCTFDTGDSVTGC